MSQSTILQGNPLNTQDPPNPVPAHYTLKTTSTDEAAILIATGHSCLSAEMEGPRVVFHFQDPEGGGARILSRHVTYGTRVNSRRLLDAYRWVLDQSNVLYAKGYAANRGN